jgi:hypothetical protein
MPVITNFGDVTTQGNTTLQQNLTVQGESATFTGSILAASSAVGIGNAASTFGTLYATMINATTLNTTSLAGFVGIGTSSATATLQVQGNVAISNSLSTTNIHASGSMNTSVINTGSLTATTSVGVGTAPQTGGPTLHVVGNLYASNAVTATGLHGTSANLSSTLNTNSIVSLVNVGIGTTPPSGGANLVVQGNIYASNAVTTTNVSTTGLNTTTINALSIFGQSGFVGVGTNAPSGTALYVAGNIYASNALTTTNVSVTLANTTTMNAQGIFGRSGFVGVGTNAPSGTALYVVGNVYASNAVTTTNVSATLANTTTMNTIGIFGQSGFVGVGTNAPSGTALYVAGNVYASNAVTTTNVSATLANATTLNTLSLVTQTGFLAVNAASASGTTLYVAGNLFASNALVSPNIFTTNINATTLNTLSLFTRTGFLAVNAASASGTTLYVEGNIYASGGIVSPLLTAVNMNITTLNTLSIFGQSGFVGVNTTAPSGTSLYVSGNLYTSTTIQYGEDLNKRAPFLAPSAANSAAILNWISTTCNAADQPVSSWWATSRVPTFGNVAAGPKGSGDYAGSVLLPDGRVLFVPATASNVGFYNPRTLLFSTVSPAGLTGVTNKFRGGVLCPNGNVAFIPYAVANVGLFNPLTSVYSNIAVGANTVATGSQLRFQGGVLSPTGNVIMIPRDSANIGVFNPTTLTMTNVGPIYGGGASLFGSGMLLPNGNVVMSTLNGGQGANIGMYNTYSFSATGYTNVGPIATTGTWESACLAPNGNVVFIPATSANVVVYNPTVVTSPLATSAYRNIAAEARSGGTWAFYGAALLPSGNIICVPSDSRNVGMIDPIALTYSNSTPVGGLSNKFFGGSLTVSGQVVFAPASAANVGIINTMVPAPQEFCMNPLFNKF